MESSRDNSPTHYQQQTEPTIFGQPKTEIPVARHTAGLISSTSLNLTVTARSQCQHLEGRHGGGQIGSLTLANHHAWDHNHLTAHC
jgi:hypothetical protein